VLLSDSRAPPFPDDFFQSDVCFSLKMNRPSFESFRDESPPWKEMFRASLYLKRCTPKSRLLHLYPSSFPSVNLLRPPAQMVFLPHPFFTFGRVDQFKSPRGLSASFSFGFPLPQGSTAPSFDPKHFPLIDSSCFLDFFPGCRGRVTFSDVPPPLCLLYLTLFLLRFFCILEEVLIAAFSCWSFLLFHENTAFEGSAGSCCIAGKFPPPLRVASVILLLRATPQSSVTCTKVLWKPSSMRF